MNAWVASHDNQVRCSVVIPTYNRAIWLPGCVASVRAGGIEGLEIVVVDDGSTDDTRAVVAALGPDVRYLHQPNGGISAACNRGIEAARGRFLGILGSDDRWLPDAPGRLLTFLERHPEVGAGFGDANYGNARDGYQSWIEVMGGRTFREVACRSIEGDLRVLDRAAFFRRLVGRRQPVFVGATLVRRQALDQVGQFNLALQEGEDWELWMRLAAYYPFAFFAQPVAVYERHADNLSNDADLMQRMFVNALRSVLALPLPLNAAERALVRSRLREETFAWAYAAYDRGEMASARARLARPRAGEESGLRELLYWSATWLGGSNVRRLRRLKRRIEGSGAPA